MSEKKMTKETIEEREYTYTKEAFEALARFKYANMNADLIETEDGWKIVLFRWVEGKPKPFISGGYINAKVLTELKADEQVINFKKIKEEALAEYGKELEKDVVELVKETHEKFAKEERDAFIKSLEPAKPSDSYGWDFDKINELREKQDKERLEREGERKLRKERHLNGLIKTFDEVFWFIRKYNTKGIEEMKKHNDLYIRIREELDKAHEEKYRDFRKNEESE